MLFAVRAGGRSSRRGGDDQTAAEAEAQRLLNEREVEEARRDIERVAFSLCFPIAPLYVCRNPSYVHATCIVSCLSG
jgi:hypothetical protein